MHWRHWCHEPPPAAAWLLRFIAGLTYTVFIVYRVVLGTIVLTLVASGAVAAT